MNNIVLDFRHNYIRGERLEAVRYLLSQCRCGICINTAVRN